MPKVAYSEEDRTRIRAQLVSAALELMARQGIQHTTVEQVYRAAGISRTFFYTFFPAKEDLIVEALTLQQPRVISFARSLMEDPALSWGEGVAEFLRACCYGERSGIVVLTIEEQQHLFHHLTAEGRALFRQRQKRLFGQLLECFGVRPDPGRVDLFTNMALGIMVLRRGVPDALPLLVPEALDETVAFQIGAIVDWMAHLRRAGRPDSPRRPGR